MNFAEKERRQRSAARDDFAPQITICLSFQFEFFSQSHQDLVADRGRLFCASSTFFRAMPKLIQLLLGCLLAACTHGYVLPGLPRTQLARTTLPCAMCSPPEGDSSAGADAAPAPPAAPPPAAPEEPTSFLSEIPGIVIVFGGAAILGFMPFLKTGIITPPSS